MKDTNDKIDILMATYNAEKYIREQIDSILNQSYNNINLIICDDNSTDNTPNILKEYENEHSHIQVIYNNENIGVINNFSKLMKISKSNYIMFSDHDDVWLRGKIEKSLQTIKDLEKKYTDLPLLVFTDKYITDSDLNIISNSHMEYEKLNSKKFTLNRILTQNSVSGCAMLFNRKLLEIFHDFSKETIMHDYYLTILAATFGHIYFINEPLMYYRQHNSNEVGSSKYSAKNILLKGIKVISSEFKNNTSYNILSHYFFNNIAQAESIYNEYKDQMSETNKHIFEEFISLKDKRRFRFIYTCIKNGFFKTGLIRNLAMYFRFMK